MHVRSVTLSGFKSFAQPTRWLIHPGVNGIVGPVGCGKSNLIAGLFWGIGSSRDDDCIFRGTDDYPPADTAEVEIVLAGVPRSWGDTKLRRVAARGKPSPAVTPDSAQVGERIHHVTTLQELNDAVGRRAEREIFVIDGLDADSPPSESELFTNCIRTLRQSNQLLIITARKSTMALANMLVCVTMEQYGVSALLYQPDT